MFVAVATRTMATAKFKSEQPPAETINLLQVKRERLRQQCVEMEQRIEAQNVVLENQREQAARSIAAANSALKKLHEEWAIEARKMGQLQCRLVDNALTLKQVVHRISKATGVSALEIASSRRDAPIVFARQAVFYWAVRRTPLSSTQIGNLTGNRDHSTVLHGCRAYRAKRAKMGRHLRSVR